METDYDFGVQQALVARAQAERIERMNRYTRAVRAGIRELAPALSTVGAGVTAELIQFYENEYTVATAVRAFIANRQE